MTFSIKNGIFVVKTRNFEPNFRQKWTIFGLNSYSIIEFDVINNLRASKLDFILKILEISENLFLFLCDYNFWWSPLMQRQSFRGQWVNLFYSVPILSRASSLEMGSWRARWMAPSHWLLINIILKMKGGHLFVNLYIDKHIRRVYIELDV